MVLPPNWRAHGIKTRTGFIGIHPLKYVVHVPFRERYKKHKTQ